MSVSSPSKLHGRFVLMLAMTVLSNKQEGQRKLYVNFLVGHSRQASKLISAFR